MGPTDEEREEARRAGEMLEAQKPVLADLEAATGVRVAALWNFHGVPEAMASAIPVLLDHLQRDYPDEILEGIGRVLSDPAARPWWDQMRDLMLATESGVIRERMADVLGKCAKREHYEELVDFVHLTRLGQCRIYFLRPINRIGNRIEAGKGRAVVESMVGDPDLESEARAILIGKGPRQS